MVEPCFEAAAVFRVDRAANQAAGADARRTDEKPTSR
jgi:hypothetical protein